MEKKQSSGSSAPRILKKKHFRVKHQKVKLFRANEPILSVFMWGINHTINELSHVNIPVMLLPDDFRAYSKIKVDNHLFNKENMPSHFKVKEYCPLVFRNLRERFGVDDVDYRESLTRSQPTQIDSSGKSGAQFYQSYDKYFIIKSLTSEEIERMHAFLKHYHPYVVERHGNTLLPQYLGMYRLTVESVQYYFVVMRNVFSSHLSVHKKFDLKGSTVDREASDKELEKPLPTYKDNDFIKQKIKIHIGELAKEKLFETLNNDVNFLTKLHIMDYSLLVGIHDCVRAEEEHAQRESAAREARDGTGGGGGGGAGAGGGTSESEECDSGERRTTNASQISTSIFRYSTSAAPSSATTATTSEIPAGLLPSTGAIPIPNQSPSHRSYQQNRYKTSVTSISSNYAATDFYNASSSAPRWTYNTPPDSPRCIGNYNEIIHEIDIYALPSIEDQREIYFMAIIDVLTQYGVKKQAAKAAKTVKYGSNVDGISTCDPEQYAKRFIEFMDKAIE